MKWHVLFLYLVFIVAGSVNAADKHTADQSIKLGIFPYVTPGQLVKFHKDLQEHLEATLQRKVVLVTAPSFKEFVKRTRQHSYDIILTAPHLGRLAEVRDQYKPIVHTMHEVQGVYLVKKSSDIQKLEDLKGKTLTMVGRTAVITQMVEKQLKELGLENSKNINFRFTKTHNNAMYAPLRGETDASVTGILLWNKIGNQQREQVRVIGTTPGIIGFQIMAAPGMNDNDIKKISDALQNYHNTQKGKIYMNKTGFKYFDPVDEKEKQQLDPFIQIFLKQKQ